MRLAAFIRSNEKALVAEWEAFARTCEPAADQMDRAALRDHIFGLLRIIADDLEISQPEPRPSKDENEESQKVAEVAGVHGEQRFTEGFDTVQMISEFRALRASVLKLWRAEWTESETVLPDLIRFNEVIDQIMTESLARFTEKLERSRDLFLGILVHDIRNPLAAVFGAATALQAPGMKDKLDNKQSQLVALIGKGSSRISRLVSELIDVVRARLGKGMPITPAPMDIGAAVQQVAEEVRTAHPDRKIAVKTAGNLEGEWDRTRIEQVLSNLIGNAVQHGLRTSVVDVVVNGADQEVVLSVHNEGVIPLAALTTIFDPLTRGEDDNQLRVETTTSLGLGLFIARVIVVAHGGEISVTSSEEEGTTFTAHLPRKSHDLQGLHATGHNVVGT